MFRINFKIVFRNLRRYPANTLINIGGIAVAITAFIVIILYTQYERNFDAGNANYEEIYLVGRDLPDNVTNYTSPELAKQIKENCPEVELLGKIKYVNFEFALFSPASRIYVKNVLTADFDAYRILNLHTSTEPFEKKQNGDRNFFLSQNDYRTLFPDSKDVKRELVGIGNRALDMKNTVDGTFNPNPHSNFLFDALALAEDISVGQDSADYSYMTFIQVKPNTDISNLESKIDRIYKQILMKDAANSQLATRTNSTIFLDPLKNLHLNPKAGSGTSKKVVDVIMGLGLLVLLLGCVNAINMNIAQATRRAKEIGIKKVMGVCRENLVLQFIVEVFAQCLIAAILGLILAEFALPVFNRVFDIQLSLWDGDSTMLLLIPLILFITTLVSGLYPAVVLSSYKPAQVLKGNFENGLQSQWLKKSLLVFQFSIAIAFITGLLIVRSQLNYMQTEDKGFSSEQVIYIRNQGIFDKDYVFKPVKDKIMKIDGVKAVTVTNNIPTSPKPLSQLFLIDGKENYYSPVNVGFDYFETLDVRLLEGRLFSDKFGTDTASSVILNEAAVKRYNIANPVGKTIRGCNTSYQIIGVIKDFKSEGFEKAVEPTVYSMKNQCAGPMLQIMVKVDENKMSKVLASLKSDWAEINKVDGDDFRYDFVDALYRNLFKKQEQLKFIFSCLSVVTILIALFGIYGYAKYIVSARLKEIAVRKILGATNIQVLQLLNMHFIWLVVLSNMIAGLAVYLTASRWLENFAYKQAFSVTPFLLTFIATTILILFTVCIQASRALKTNPVKILKYE